MSDTNTNTNTDTNDDAIQKRKNQSTGNADVGGFIKNFAFSMVGIILFIIFGTSWLYIAKLSTAKTIPIDTVYEPYTCEKNPNFGSNGNNPIKVPMNTFSELDFKGLKFWGEPIGKWEQEATFASQGFIKSFNHSFISNLRKKTDNPVSASNFDKFKSILVNNVVGTGFWLYDKISMPDSVRMLPDSLKIVIYGLFGLMFFPFFWICNGMASFYYTIRTLFNGEKTSQDNPNEGGYDGGLFDGVDALKNGDSLLSNFGKMFLRGLVWIPIWLIIIPVLSMFVFPAIGTFYPFFKMLFSAGYKLKEYDPFKADKQTDSKSCLDFIKDNLVYKRTLILVFAILNLFTCANTYLGAQYFGGVVLATILAVIFGNIFVNTEPDDATMISVKAAIEEPVLEKPAAVDDDDCGPFQNQVINAWKKLKAQNDEADRLIQQFGNSGNTKIQNEIFKLKTQRANIIEQFKKLDGTQDPNDVTVQNTDGIDVKYGVLADAYKDFVDICSKDITEAQVTEQKEKEQQEKEQQEKEQAAQKAREERVAAGNVVSATTATTPSATTNNNNNNSATGGGGGNKSSAIILPVSQTVVPPNVLNTFIGNRNSDVTPSSSSSSSSGGSSREGRDNKLVENAYFKNSTDLLQNVDKDNEHVVKTELQNLNEQYINVILEIYRQELAKITTTEDEIKRIQKYLPMIIEKQRQLNGEEPLPEYEMTAYIRQKFPTHRELSAKNVDIWTKHFENDLADLNADKAGGGSNPVVSRNQIKQPPANKEQELARNKVMTSIINKTPLNTKLDILDQANLDFLINQATERFVKGKGPIELKRNKTLFEIITQLLNEKYKADNNMNKVVAELIRISAQQADGSYTLTGGSKGKNKTLKNRRQRFNIRLV